MPRLNLLFLVLFLAVGGCALPTVPSAGVNPVQLGKEGSPKRVVLATLCVTNASRDALVFRRATIRFGRTNDVFATGSIDDPFVVPALSLVRRPLTISITQRHLVAQGVENARTREIRYRVDGLVALDRAFGLNIPYRRSGRLALDVAQDLVLSTAASTSTRCSPSDLESV